MEDLTQYRLTKLEGKMDSIDEMKATLNILLERSNQSQAKEVKRWDLTKLLIGVVLGALCTLGVQVAIKQLTPPTSSTGVVITK